MVFKQSLVEWSQVFISVDLTDGKDDVVPLLDHATECAQIRLIFLETTMDVNELFVKHVGHATAALIDHILVDICQKFGLYSLLFSLLTCYFAVSASLDLFYVLIILGLSIVTSNFIHLAKSLTVQVLLL